MSKLFTTVRLFSAAKYLAALLSSRGKKTVLRFACLYVVLSLCSCSYARNSNLREDFEQSMKGYNKMLRWHEVENAGMLYIDRELREAFMQVAERIKKRGVTITDYRILTSECLPEKETAEVVVEFDFYALPSNRIKTVTYHQKWVYSGDEGKKYWQLKTQLPAFE